MEEEQDINDRRRRGEVAQDEIECPSSKGSICGHGDEAFHTLLFYNALHIIDVLGLSSLGLIATGRNVCHALAGRIGPPAETVRHGVVLLGNVDHCEVELGQGLVPSRSTEGWS